MVMPFPRLDSLKVPITSRSILQEWLCLSPDWIVSKSQLRPGVSFKNGYGPYPDWIGYNRQLRPVGTFMNGYGPSPDWIVSKSQLRPGVSFKNGYALPQIG